MPKSKTASAAAASVASSLDINIFAGAGGLALGLKQAGAAPSYLYEVDKHGWETCRLNAVRKGEPPGWADHKGDVRLVDWSQLKEPVRILAGGVPCQPFSHGGKHEAQADSRNLFPQAVRAIRELRPRAVLIENVHGLLREDFRHYFEYVMRCLAMPSVLQRDGERWQSHNVRLRERQQARGYTPEYTVKYQALNAADYGVAQLRRRVFIVAMRQGESEFEFPAATHSRAALIHAQYSGKYWDRWAIGSRIRHRKKDLPPEDDLLPWVTTRDVIAKLPPAADDEEESRTLLRVPNHWIIDGAKSYTGHSGSDPDWPSKTIKAGVHGVPGGENTLRLGQKRIRYYTLREAAVIQSFPTDYDFYGARLNVTRQIGNAVPPVLARILARAVLRVLDSQASRNNERSVKRPADGRANAA